MRTVLMLVALGIATSASATTASATTASAASADVTLTAEGVARPADAGPIYVKVRSTADSDGDGVGDAAVLRLHCAGLRLVAAALRHEVVTAREAGSAIATGRRAASAAAAAVKEWGPSTPQFRELLPRIRITPTSAVDGTGWTTVRMASSEGICAGVGAPAGAIINTSRSNIRGQ